MPGALCMLGSVESHLMTSFDAKNTNLEARKHWYYRAGGSDERVSQRGIGSDEYVQSAIGNESK